MNKSITVILLFAAMLGATPSGQAETAVSIDQIGFDQRLNETIPQDLDFRNEQGNRVSLQSFLGAGPVILVPAYYTCPNLCGLTLEGLAESVGRLALKAGQAFRVVIVSIDPEETAAAASAKKAELSTRYPAAGITQGWHLLTGDAAAVNRLTDRIGFRYAHDPTLGQYAHAAGIVLLTTEGRIAHYFLGIRFPSQTLRLGLVQAAEGRIGSAMDRILLMCYDYDPVTGRYSLTIVKALRLAGLGTVATLGIFVGVMLFRERRQR